MKRLVATGKVEARYSKLCAIVETPMAVPTHAAESSRQATLGRLEDQIAWYDRKSGHNQRWHYRLKIATLLSASLIPFTSGLAAPAVVTGGLGVLVVLFEGLQQLLRFHHNWVTYRSTCESLKHEKYLFLGDAGPYANAAQPHRLLAERVESLVSTETAKWATHQEQSGKKDGASQ